VVWDHGVAGSNPVLPTKASEQLLVFFLMTSEPDVQECDATRVEQNPEAGPMGILNLPTDVMQGITNVEMIVYFFIIPSYLFMF
jgi:hypothetical protein